MQFAKELRERIRRGRIRCTVRVWIGPRVKVGGRYPMEGGHVVVDSIEPIRMRDITHDLARESGFESVEDLLKMAKHGRGTNVYLIRFHYLPPGGWEYCRFGASSAWQCCRLRLVRRRLPVRLARSLSAHARLPGSPPGADRSTCTRTGRPKPAAGSR